MSGPEMAREAEETRRVLVFLDGLPLVVVQATWPSTTLDEMLDWYADVADVGRVRLAGRHIDVALFGGGKP